MQSRTTEKGNSEQVASSSMTKITEDRPSGQFQVQAQFLQAFDDGERAYNSGAKVPQLQLNSDEEFHDSCDDLFDYMRDTMADGVKESIEDIFRCYFVNVLEKVDCLCSHMKHNECMLEKIYTDLVERITCFNDRTTEQFEYICNLLEQDKLFHRPKQPSDATTPHRIDRLSYTPPYEQTDLSREDTQDPSPVLRKSQIALSKTNIAHDAHPVPLPVTIPFFQHGSATGNLIVTPHYGTIAGNSMTPYKIRAKCDFSFEDEDDTLSAANNFPIKTSEVTHRISSELGSLQSYRERTDNAKRRQCSAKEGNHIGSLRSSRGSADSGKHRQSSSKVGSQIFSEMDSVQSSHGRSDDAKSFQSSTKVGKRISSDIGRQSYTEKGHRISSKMGSARRSHGDCDDAESRRSSTEIGHRISSKRGSARRSHGAHVDAESHRSSTKVCAQISSEMVSIRSKHESCDDTKSRRSYTIVVSSISPDMDSVQISHDGHDDATIRRNSIKVGHRISSDMGSAGSSHAGYDSEKICQGTSKVGPRIASEIVSVPSSHSGYEQAKSRRSLLKRKPAN